MSNKSKVDGELLDALKHYDSFYEKLPPGLVKDEVEEKPEDVIPDRPENSAARDFLAKAPTKGLWMPLGKEVKVMKCWRCKIYGHRTGDKECPLFLSGNKESEAFRHAHEDPMYNYVKDSETRAKIEKLEILKALLDKDKEKKKKNKKKKHKKRKKKKLKQHDLSSSSSSSSSSSDSESESESKHSRKRKRKHKKKHKRHRHHKKDKK